MTEYRVVRSSDNERLNDDLLFSARLGAGFVSWDQLIVRSHFLCMLTGPLTRSAATTTVNDTQKIRIIKVDESPYAVNPEPMKGRYRDMVKMTRIISHGLVQVHFTYRQ